VSRSINLDSQKNVRYRPSVRNVINIGMFIQALIQAIYYTRNAYLHHNDYSAHFNVKFRRARPSIQQCEIEHPLSGCTAWCSPWSDPAGSWSG
jgi:hypothetical protein